MSSLVASARKRPLNPDHVRALKAGLDQGGVPRSFHEVAKICEISVNYTRRLHNGGVEPRLAKPKQWTDPRAYIPDLAAQMSDEDVQAWNADPRCLCGCGEPCRQEVSNGGRVPMGQFRLFRGAHEKRMPWAGGPLARINADAELCRTRGLTMREANIDSLVITGLIHDWREENPHTPYSALSEKAHLSPSHVRSIAIGRHPRIAKLTAAKLLVALDEPLRPELFAEYREWAKAEGVPWRGLVVST